MYYLPIFSQLSVKQQVDIQMRRYAISLGVVVIVVVVEVVLLQMTNRAHGFESMNYDL